MATSGSIEGNSKGNSAGRRWDAVLEVLKGHADAIKAMEDAALNGVRLIPDNSDKDNPMVTPDTDLDPGSAVVQSIVAVLASKADNIKAITRNPNGLRETLCNAQAAMSKENHGFLVGLGLWTRLEKTYRSLFTSDTACIHGDKGCPDHYELTDAEQRGGDEPTSAGVVLCTACKGVKNGV